MKFVTYIDLTQNELRNAVISNLSGAPTSPKPGQIYFDTTNNTGWMWDGSSWKSLFQLVIDDTQTSTTTVWSSTKIQNELNAITSQMAGGMNFIGSYDAAANSPDIESGTNISKGDTYVVSVAGDFFTEAVQPGDMMIAKVDSPTQLSDWVVVNKNIPDINNATETAPGLIEIATQAEVNAGTATDLAVTPATLQSAINSSIKSYATSISLGDSVGDSVITHNLNTLDVIVQFAVDATGEVVMADVKSKSANSITVAAYGPTQSYRVIIKG